MQSTEDVLLGMLHPRDTRLLESPCRHLPMAAQAMDACLVPVSLSHRGVHRAGWCLVGTSRCNGGSGL